MVTLRGLDFPENLHYLMEHDTWAQLDADGNVTVGLTALGAKISGEFIDFMPKPVGSTIERDRSIGALEMSKVIRSTRSPLTGTIVATNDQVKQRATLINDDPYGEGWLVRIAPADWNADSQRLVTGAAIEPAAKAYMALLDEQFDGAS